MDQVIGELFGRAIVEVVALGVGAAVKSCKGNNGSNNSNSTTQQQTKIFTSPPSIKHERAVLTSSSTIIFGNDCERLVNIAFRTSQTFPSMMGTYADVNKYLREELSKQHPDEYFHIIIGKNHEFGYSIDDGHYFAEIQQDRYRVLIFSTKQNPHIKTDIHDADSHMPFIWN
ncbi:unnamed protein product [Adineta steineri]|uniref:Uncharacterized protein n=1 Tax=Adineta steineri TaxID=433720 RepID=A0A814Q715_9BILA|nr:unnamed protein product [Adineta steineri]CAF3718178.1 unnamed protein product [Adineta steineri]